MAETPMTGLTASVKLGESTAAKVVAYISGVNLDVSKEIIEILSFGKQFKEKVPAIKDWSGSVDGTVAFTQDGTQYELIKAFDSGEAVTLGIYLTDNCYFTGKALISDYSIDTAPDDKVNLSCNFAGTDAVTLSFGG